MENKKVSIIIMIALAACAAVFAGLYFFTVFSSIPQKNYTEAVAFYELKNYEAAEAKFRDLGSYRDSAEYLEKISVERTYDHAVKAYEAGDFETSKELFSQIGDYEDSGAYLKKIDEAQIYEKALEAFVNEDYETAESAFEEISGYSDSEEYIKQISNERVYQEACELYKRKEYDAARELFATIPDYKDVEEIVAKMESNTSFNDYIDRLSQYGDSVENMKELSSSLIHNAAEIWENCRNKTDSAATDKYTKNSFGEFHEDPDTALTAYYWSDEFAGIRDSIITEKISADGQFEYLKELPADLSDCTAKVFVLHSTGSSLADLALDMSGDITAVRAGAEEVESSFDTALEEFRLAIQEKREAGPAAFTGVETEAETGAEEGPAPAETVPAVIAAETEAETMPVTTGTEAETAPAAIAAGTEAETAPAVIAAGTEAETTPAAIAAGTEAETAPAAIAAGSRG